MAIATVKRVAIKDGKSPKGTKSIKSPPVMMSVDKPERAVRRNGEEEGATGAGRESLEKVRDILFGAQMRDSDQRFGRLEERLGKEATDVRDETRKRMDSLEAFVRKELTALADRFKTEQTQRADALRELALEQKENSKGLEKRLSEIGDVIGQAESTLRQELLEQSKTLREEIQESAQNLTAAIDQAAGELRAEKTDRAALADLFSEMAIRLNEGARR